MPGCGGCQPGQCNGPCSTRQEPRTPTALTEALAKVIVDARVVKKAIEIYKENPNLTATDIVVLVTEAKERGELA